jgi:hypothetical protein
VPRIESSKEAEIPGAAGEMQVDNYPYIETEALKRDPFFVGADGRHATDRLCFAVEEGEATEASQEYPRVVTESSS